MHAFLLSIGVITTLIGIFTILFGIPINEFSFGNTLIISGTVAVIGGFILIGIAAAVRELRRIADALGGRPLMRTPRPEPGEPPAQGLGARSSQGMGRGMFPQKPAEGRDARPTEPRLSAVTSNEGQQSDPSTGRPRPNIFPMVRAVGDATVMEESESVPLSPRAPVRAASSAPMRGERASEMKSAPQSVARQSGGASPAVQGEVLEAPRLGPVAEQKVDRPQPTTMFDAVWPAESKVGVAVANDAFDRASRIESGKPRERIEPVLAVEKREDPAPRAPEPRPVSILKSGVIDGMAYTLYTDGSIEAQLSQGTMKFGSIDELRDYLESNP
jgi:hypothetical protein